MSAPASSALREWFADGEVEPLGAGHIHDTYLVTRREGRYVLQRVNEAVFRDAALLMRQTERVLRHVEGRLPYRVPQLERSRHGRVAERAAGGLWRMWRYLENTCVVDPLVNSAQAFAAARAFGRLQACLADLPGPPLDDTIPGFLQLPHYLAEFERVAAKASREERALVADHGGLVDAFAARNSHIHGDCKVNNVLFRAGADEVAAIIDFDTVMHGHWAWDFGDLVRSIYFSRGDVEIEFFEACAGGFAAGRGAAGLAPGDLAGAPVYVAFMLGLRFLTDHLSGDRYFKVRRRGENLARADEQFALARRFTALAGPMRAAAERALG